jgi:hypothetical protein
MTGHYGGASDYALVACKTGVPFFVCLSNSGSQTYKKGGKMLSGRESYRKTFTYSQPRGKIEMKKNLTTRFRAYAGVALISMGSIFGSLQNAVMISNLPAVVLPVIGAAAAVSMVSCREDKVRVESNGDSIVLGYAPKSVSRRAAQKLTRSSAEAEYVSSLGAMVITGLVDWLAVHADFGSESEERTFFETVTTSFAKQKVRLERAYEVPLRLDKQGWVAVFRAKRWQSEQVFDDAFLDIKREFKEQHLRGKANDFEKFMKERIEKEFPG